MVTLEDIIKMGYHEECEGNEFIVLQVSMENVPKEIMEELEESHKRVSKDMKFGVPYAEAIEDGKRGNVRWYARFTYEKGLYEPYRVARGTRHAMRRGKMLLYCDIENGEEAISELNCPSKSNRDCTVNRYLLSKESSIEDVKRYVQTMRIRIINGEN